MTREEAIERLKNGAPFNELLDMKWEEAVNMAIKALEQEPCDDCISRQAVLDQTYSWSKDEFLRVTNPFDYLRKRINSLPSVMLKEKTPKEKTGHWEILACDLYMCSKCYGKYTFKSNFCPNCGAKMVESEESEGNR